MTPLAGVLITRNSVGVVAVMILAGVVLGFAAYALAAFIAFTGMDSGTRVSKIFAAACWPLTILAAAGGAFLGYWFMN